MVIAPTVRSALDPPGPLRFPGLMTSFLRDPIATTIGAWQRYGDVVRYRYLGPFFGVMLFRPEHVKHVLQENHRNYRKTPLLLNRFREVVGNGLFTSEGDEWLRQRRTLQPAFHRQRIQAFASTMVSETETMLARWEVPARTGVVIDVLPEMRRLVMRIVARSLFGAELGSEVDDIGRSVLTLLEWTSRRLYLVFDPFGDLPLPPRRSFERNLAAVRRYTQRFIDLRRASPTEHHDLLAMLLEAHDPETDVGLSDTEVHDQVMTIFLAGVDTTVNLLGWTWHVLSTHPECAQRVRGELQSVLNGRAPVIEDLPRLPYTSMVLEETMRLYPPAWATTRITVSDDEIDGYRMRSGESVLLSQWVTHRLPEFWDNPEGFDPERFTPERSKNRPRFAYFPFGGGPRQCIGNTFAMMEAQIIVATILQRYRLDLAPGAVIRPKPVIGLRPAPGVPVRLKPGAWQRKEM
jgi:cytochrome P450